MTNRNEAQETDKKAAWQCAAPGCKRGTLSSGGTFCKVHRKTEAQVVECLMDLFDNEEAVRESELGEALSRKHAQTFKEAGILTSDEGLVLRMADGRRLFLTVQIQEGR